MNSIVLLSILLAVATVSASGLLAAASADNGSEDADGGRRCPQ